MIGTLLNTAAVVAGTLAGRTLGTRLPARLQETAMAGIGLMTLLLGAQNALKTQNALLVLGAILLGGILGEMLGIDARINRLGRWAERRFDRTQAGTFGRAFVTTSLLFCVGPLTILGCFEDGMTGHYKLLAVKSLLDGVSSLAFSATLGWGVLPSAGTVLVVQGTLTLAAGFLKPLLTDAMIREMTAAGGVMLLGLGLNLLGVTRIRVASFLPALLLAPLLAH